MKPAKKTAKPRARRGVPHLTLNRSGIWSIAWPREIASAAHVPRLESLGVQDRKEADRLHRLRVAEVYDQIGRPEVAAEIRRTIEAIPIDQLISDFLRALHAGECAPTPSQSTIANVYLPALLGAKDGLKNFADARGRKTSTQVDAPFVEQWLDAGRLRSLAANTLRLRLVCVRRLTKWACQRGYIGESAMTAIAGLKRPKGAKGRAKTDGVPSGHEIRRVIAAMSPPYWRVVAECQFRLGLRMGEVLSMSSDWVDEAHGQVRVRLSADFTTKDNEERKIPTDPHTLALAREVVALRSRKKLSRWGYRMAWRRAIDKVVARGGAWNYRAKTHALRQFYATESAASGIAVAVIAEHLGHSSVKVTEAHYIGLIDIRTATPFAGLAPMSLPGLPAANDVRVAANG